MSSDRGTSSGTIACQAGPFIAAVCISATNRGEVVREVINQAPAVSSIQPPMLETIEAIWRSRNKDLRSGLQAEVVKVIRN